MVHEMRLNPSPFEKIANGTKTIELRLFDEKRRRIGVGDFIVFTNLSDENERITTSVKALYRYASFRELFDELPMEECGNSGNETPEQAAARMLEYYSDEKVLQYGVLGIRIRVADLEDALKKQNGKSE